MSEPSSLRVRRATTEDALAIWEWANERSARGQSFHPEPIPLTEHVAWYAARMGSPDCRIWVACDGDRPVGQVRYDRTGVRAEVAITIAAEHRARGLGRYLLRTTASMACDELSVEALVALILDGNDPSMRAFEAAGYVAEGREQRNGRWAVRLTRACGADGRTA